MQVRNEQKIGICFNKENIFLATFSSSDDDTKEILKANSGVLEANVDDRILDSMLDMVISTGAVSTEQYDVFYKNEKGYTRFVEEGPETFAGDGSDGKSLIRNVVPVWSYYSEEQLTEVMVNNEFWAICILDNAPLERYNKDFNYSNRIDVSEIKKQKEKC